MCRHRFLLAVLALCLVVPATAFAQPDAKNLAVEARGILKRYCHQCHAGRGSESGMEFDVLRVGTLITKTAVQAAVVIPGKADESLLLKVMTKPANKPLARMPPRAVKDRPSDAEREIIVKWIAAGAPAAPEQQRPFLAVQHVLKTIRDDLEAVQRKNALAVKFQRYFTLTHLHNHPTVTADDLALYRAALAKALSSLTWENAVVTPRPVDKEATVLAVDLRDLGWDPGRKDHWQSLLAAYPYGLRYTNHPDRALSDLDKAVGQLGGCELVHVRADWFVAVATRPPLYHTLLNLPHSDFALENKLGVDVRKNFDNGTLARAGFSKSGVSGQNRMIERHKAAYGAYWKSYDFKPKSARSDLRQLPLGPLDLFPEKQHPFPDQAFAHDGGELIFNLPNGLQGYLLINGRGDRIDEGPQDVVSDSLKTAGSNAIVNGLSCMACHVQGPITAFKDQIRAGAAVFGKARTKVQDLYPAAADLDKRLKEDEIRFLAAARKSMAPFLPGCNDIAGLQAALKKTGEPIGVVARAYYLQPLDATTVAVELGLEKSADLLKIGPPRLRQLGLAVLLQDHGSINRAEWDNVAARSLMQRVAVELDATPFTVLR